ncbi:MAG: indolepyruvate/phenylpyruvate decarboxylase [Betaproteobacteria bacterium]|nr:indolepyruvate/phenylpyruvate decarboxylase [Betaproteobacteria bacterium]
MSTPSRTHGRHSVATELLGALAGVGAREIFGIPGDFALPFFDAVEADGRLPLYTLSHEPAVGFAADAAARMRCAPSIAAVTYGAGAFNIVNAVASAFAEKSPVVVISGAPGAHERGSGLLLHHQAKTIESQYEMFRHVTCDQARLDDPATAGAQIARVLASAQRYSRPVYVELPRDTVNAPCAPAQAEPAPPVDREALAACADEILGRLGAARSPVLMVDVEVRRFGLEPQVAALARRLAIPVVTTLMGRGLLENADAPLVGTYLGLAGIPEVSALVEESDGLLLLGVIVCDTNFGVSARRVDLRHAIQALDGRVTLGFHTYADMPLASLVEALLERAQPLASAQAVSPVEPPRGLVRDAAAVQPLDVSRALNDAMDTHGRMPVATDVGDCLFTAMDLQQTDHVAPGYYATMGFGVPAGLGVQAASGRRPLVLVGDGAFQMTGMELGHCARHGWDPVVVVLNNGGWGMLSAFRPDAHYNALGTWNLARVADALGGAGHLVRTRAELAQALETAITRPGRFHLLDVRIAPGALSPALRRFADAVARLQG